MYGNLTVPLEVDVNQVAVDLEVSGGVQPILDGDYEKLSNKPHINGVELVGDKTSEELGIVIPVTSVNSKTGDVVLYASDIGLGNVDNTSDAEKKTAFTGEISPLSDGFVTGKDINAKLVDYLPKSGGTMTGNISMGQRRITSDYVPTIWSYDASVLVNRTYVDNKFSSLGTVLNFKGVVDSYDDLPETGNKKGEVYINAEDSSEFVWVLDSDSGDGWEQFGPNIDLSGYATLDYVDGELADKVDAADYAPVAKTAAMTQAVGKDGVGQLWTAPELPAVSAADNGKVLTVVGGSWAAAALPVYDGGVTYGA